MSQLVLSLFPGIGLLDMAFEEEGFCVVRGPDLLWGGDIRRFHPPSNKFSGVIGGPPCQAFSSLARLNLALGNTPKFGNLIPEFERVVREAQPRWFLMENVEGAPVPSVVNYGVWATLLEDRMVGGATERVRRFSFGRKGWPERGQPLPIASLALAPCEAHRAVTGDARIATVGQRIRSRQRGGGTLPNTGRCAPLEQMTAHQGLPEDFLRDAPFTGRAKRQMIGNGVPLHMGRAVAQAIRQALGVASE